MSADRPNIIVFFSDQQRWDTCGCYGQRLPITPNLDQMASEGVRFESAFTCQPVCGPARSCLQTGKWATQTGCFTNNRALRLDEITLAQRLSAAGYETGYIGKWHLASDTEHNFRELPVPPERRGGYDYWLASDVLEFTSHPFEGHMFDGDGNRVDFEGYRVDRETDFVLDYLNTRDGERPFFLFVSYLEPHHQNDLKRFVGPEGSKERFAEYDVPGDLVGTQGDWRENYPDYLGACASLDHNLGRVREALSARGLLDNTLVIYTSDHGSHFCTRNSEYKRSCHDGCLRIPMVLSGPGFPTTRSAGVSPAPAMGTPPAVGARASCPHAVIHDPIPPSPPSRGAGVSPASDAVNGGIVCHHLASLIDLPPTILAAAGVPIPDTMAGRPLQQALADAPDWPTDVFAQISESQVGRCLRTKKWKYSVRAPESHPWNVPDSDVYIEDFLYDLENDPHERENLVASPAHKEVRAQLAARLQQRLREAGERPAQIRPA